MTEIVFVVPGDAVGKGRPRAARTRAGVRMYTPAKTVAYENLISLVAQEAMQGRVLITGPVLCEINITVQVPQSWSKKRKAMALEGLILPTTKPDKDNVIKAVYDGINGIVWKDDVQVVDGYQRKRYGEVPGVHVRIVPLDAEPAQGKTKTNSDNFIGEARA